METEELIPNMITFVVGMDAYADSIRSDFLKIYYGFSEIEDQFQYSSWLDHHQKNQSKIKSRNHNEL